LFACFFWSDPIYFPEDTTTTSTTTTSTTADAAEPFWSGVNASDPEIGGVEIAVASPGDKIMKMLLQACAESMRENMEETRQKWQQDQEWDRFQSLIQFWLLIQALSTLNQAFAWIYRKLRIWEFQLDHEQRGNELFCFVLLLFYRYFNRKT
jgi:hypothetical protein